MKTPREARERIQPTLDAWESDAAMNVGRNEVKFWYVTADMATGVRVRNAEILLEGRIAVVVGRGGGVLVRDRRLVIGRLVR